MENMDGKQDSARYSVGTAGTDALGKQNWLLLPGDLNLWLSRKGSCKRGGKINLSHQAEGDKVCEIGVALTFCYSSFSY